jgi:hypothetical protein
MFLRVITSAITAVNTGSSALKKIKNKENQEKSATFTITLLYFFFLLQFSHAMRVLLLVAYGIRIKGTHLRMPYAVAQVVSVSGLRTRAL